MVRLVRNKVKDSITLAIGDGANDVSMIQVRNRMRERGREGGREGVREGGREGGEREGGVYCFSCSFFHQ